MNGKILNKLSEDWNAVKSLVLYGYGRRAARLWNAISKDFEITYIIDNNPKLKGTMVEGKKIYAFEEIKDALNGNKILVTTGGGSYFSIKESLEKIGLREHQDFCRYEDFLTEWYWKNRGQVIMSECFLCVLSRCTFRCVNCNQLMPHYSEKTHYECTVDEIEETMAAFFSKADFLMSFFIIGGEPLLHKDLPQIMEMLCEKYGDKIGYIQIITNGSIVPSPKLIDVIKKYDIDIRLSDYTYEIPYDKKISEVKEVLSKNGVPFSMSTYEEWFDVGIPGKEEEQFASRAEIKQHAIDCGPCHVIADKKFYYCGTFYNAERCGFIKLQEGDYIDLTAATTAAEKEKLLAYSLGEFENGCIEVCNRCFGKSEKNPRIVRPAIQMKGENIC